MLVGIGRISSDSWKSFILNELQIIDSRLLNCETYTYKYLSKNSLNFRHQLKIVDLFSNLNNVSSLKILKFSHCPLSLQLPIYVSIERCKYRKIGQHKLFHFDCHQNEYISFENWANSIQITIPYRPVTQKTPLVISHNLLFNYSHCCLQVKIINRNFKIYVILSTI